MVTQFVGGVPMKEVFVTLFSPLESSDAVKVVGIICATGIGLAVLACASGSDISIGLAGLTISTHNTTIDDPKLACDDYKISQAA
jgi:hypothetical protein